MSHYYFFSPTLIAALARVFFVLFSIFAGAQLTHAQGFVPLSDSLPGPIQNAINNVGPNSIPELIDGFFIVSVGVAGLLAVIMITIAGIKYVGSDSFSSKSDAKDQIRSAIIGLLLILASYLLLYTINPDLTNLSPLRNAQPINYSGNQSVGGANTQIRRDCDPSESCSCPDGYIETGRSSQGRYSQISCNLDTNALNSAATEAGASLDSTPADPDFGLYGP